MSDFIKTKKLYTLNDDGSNRGQFYTVRDEIFLTADPIEGLFSYNDYKQAIYSPISRRVVRVYLLNDDETIKQEITEDLTACSVELTYEQGKTHSASITLINTDGKWTPNPTSGFLWKGSLFRIYIGIYYNERVFWGDFGIFTPLDPTVDDRNKTVSFQMEDKFAFLDGTITGKMDSDVVINVGTPVYEAISMCLVGEQENNGWYDRKPIIYPRSKQGEVTPYTIKKTPGITYGEIITELCDMISCDVGYNSNGNLVISTNRDEDGLENRAILWHFDDTTKLFVDPSFSMSLTSVVNKVTVVGAIENGYRFKGVAINTNAKSPTNIYTTGLNPDYIEDNNIPSDPLCQERAEYELQKKGLLALQTKFDCVFIPHLLPNNLVAWTNREHGFRGEKFFINSISIDASASSLMSISLTNVNEVIL